jgi:hypothetical protein
MILSTNVLDMKTHPEHRRPLSINAKLPTSHVNKTSDVTQLFIANAYKYNS